MKTIRRGAVGVITLLLLLCSASATSASAEVRTATVTDPQDAVGTVSGVPNNPDLRELKVTYDTAGSLTLEVSFYNAVNSLDVSQNYAFWSDFVVGDWTLNGANANCGTEVSGQHHVYAAGSTFFDRATIAGLDGYLNFNRVVSPDNKTITVTATSSALANRNLRCFTYDLGARRRSTVDNLNSRYDPGCDCWYLSSTIDSFTGSGSSRANYFDGYAPVPPVCQNGKDDDGDGKIDFPNDKGCTAAADTDEADPPPPACSNGEDDDLDGYVDLEDPGCRGRRAGTSEREKVSYPVRARFSLVAFDSGCRIHTGVEVLPDIHPLARFPFEQVRLRVTGPSYDKRRYVRLGTTKGYSFRVRRNGRYRVRGYYTGDEWRVRSVTRQRTVRVSGCS